MDILLPRYQKDLFINREDEIGVVENAVQHIPDKRIIMFRGSRGLGKSWLLFHIKRYVLRREKYPHVLCLLIGLGRNYLHRVIDEVLPGEWIRETQNGVSQKQDVIKHLLIWFAAQIHATRADDAPLDMLSSWIVQTLKQGSFGQDGKERLLVVCIDSVLETEWDFLRSLEETLLADLAELPNVLLVMSGRGKPYLWRSPRLRTKAYTHPLKKFEDTNDISNQLRSSRSEVVNHQEAAQEQVTLEEILKYSNGTPLVNYLVAQALAGRIKWKEALDEMLNVLPPNKKKLFQETIEAVCVLNVFRDFEMDIMLRARLDTQDWSLEETQKRRTELVQQNILNWDIEKKGYVLDEPIRLIATAYLQFEKPDLFIRLHRQAYTMYVELAEQSDDPEVTQRVRYHAQYVNECESAL